jgi:hypothetical protein
MTATATAWLVLDEYCTYRLRAGTPDEPANRVAFIEKTPRVQVPAERVTDQRERWGSRVGTFVLDGTAHKAYQALDGAWWVEGDKGSGGQFPEDGRVYGWDPESRQWCDDMLVALGYAFAPPEMPDEVKAWFDRFRSLEGTRALCLAFVQLGIDNPRAPEDDFDGACVDVLYWIELHRRYYNTLVWNLVEELGARDAIRAMLRRDARTAPSARRRAREIDIYNGDVESAERALRVYGSIVERSYGTRLCDHFLASRPNSAWVYERDLRRLEG